MNDNGATFQRETVSYLVDLSVENNSGGLHRQADERLVQVRWLVVAGVGQKTHPVG